MNKILGFVKKLIGWAPFWWVLFNGLMIGIYIQSCSNHISRNIFISTILISGLCIAVSFLIWLVYSYVLFRHFKYASFILLLRLDAISYLPIGVSIISGFIFSYIKQPADFPNSLVLISLGAVFFLKIIEPLIIQKDPEFLTERNKAKALADINPYNADPFFADSVIAEPQIKLRKYTVNGETRNALNLKDIPNGRFKIKAGYLDNTLNIAIGYRASGADPRGNLKLYLTDNGSRSMILNKDTANILAGWNEYIINLQGKREAIDIVWENSSKDDIYVSISNLNSMKRENARKNIVVIVLDGIIPETLGLYRGQPEADSISKFFNNTTIFTNAYVQGEWTLPNFASIATSLYQQHHGVCDPDVYFKTMSYNNKTMAEILQENGYNTFGYVSHYRASPDYGHARGYNRFIYKQTGDGFKNDNTDITLNALRFLKQNQHTNNFVFLHYFDTHAPYFQSVENAYNTHVARYQGHVDKAVSKRGLNQEDTDFLRELYLQKFKEVAGNLQILFDYIDKYEKGHTTVIFTSDHGVPLFENDLKTILPPAKGGRDRMLVDSLVKVPLMIRGPKSFDGKHGNTIVDNLVEASIAIMPTVLDIAGIKQIEDIDGVSIFNHVKDNSAVSKDYIISESALKDIYELWVKTNDWSYFFSSKRDRPSAKIIRKSTREIFRDSKDEPITDMEHIKRVKKRVSAILQENRLLDITE